MKEDAQGSAEEGGACIEPGQRGAEPPSATYPLSTQSTSPSHQLFLALSYRSF